MKVNLDSCVLVMMTTMGCNSACGHCYLGCNPSKAKFRLSGDEMVSVLRDARKAGVCNVTFSGGEPFLFIADLFKAVSVAADLGMQICVRTNGFWAFDENIAGKILTFLACKGVGQIGLSYDNFHSRFVDLMCIKRIVKMVKGTGMSVWLDWVGIESNKQVWKLFGHDMPIVRYVGRPTRVGQAGDLDDCYFYNYPLESVEYELASSFRCGQPDNLFLEIYPEGIVNLSHCCYGNPRLLRRRANDGDWIDRLMAEVEKDPAVAFLHRYGVGGLIRKAEREMPRLVASSYTSDCEACFSLLGRLFSKEEVGRYMFGKNGYNAIGDLGIISAGLQRHIVKVVDKFVEDRGNGYLVRVLPNEIPEEASCEA